MSINLNSFLNNPDNDDNSLIRFYVKIIDKNNDGNISDEELDQLYKEDPLTYSSIFDDISEMEKENLLNNDNFITNTNEKSNIDSTNDDSDKNKKIFINLNDLIGLNYEAFSKLSKVENSDNSISEFWNSLSNYDLNKLFNYINTDNDNILSNEELMKLSSVDGSNENLSLYDLQDFINASTNEINNDELNTDEAINKDENKVISNNSHKNKVKISPRGSQRTTTNNNSTNPIPDVRTQYQNNLDKSKAEFNSAKAKYINVLDGNINDANVKEKKKDMENAYTTWQNELSKENPTLAENINNVKTEVDDINVQILSNEKDIFNNETTLSECETAYDSARDYRVGLEDKRNELASSLSGLDTSDEKNKNKIEAFKKQIFSIETEIQNAKKEEERAKDEKDEAKDNLNKSKDNKTEIESALKEKKALLNKYMEEANKLGSKNPILSMLQNDYEDKKQSYETALKNYKEKLKSEAVSKHDEVNNRQKQLSDYDNNEKIESYNAILAEYDDDFAALLNKYLLEGASDHSKSDCGGAVRRALYKAILEKYGQDAASVFKEGFGVIGGDWDNQYLADCPLFTDITNEYSTAELESMINNGELQGAIINYEKYTGSKSGHVEGITEKGLTSDYTRPHSYFRSKSALGQAQYHIFIPRVATEQEIKDYIQLMKSRKSSYKSPI